jgi:hypothetical protein
MDTIQFDTAPCVLSKIDVSKWGGGGVICMNSFRFFPIHAAIHADYRHAVMQTCNADYQHPN